MDPQAIFNISPAKVQIAAGMNWTVFRGSEEELSASHVSKLDNA